MQRINIPWFLEVMASLDNLSSCVPGEAVSDHIFGLFSAQNNIKTLFNTSVYRQHMRVCNSKGNELSSILGSLIAKDAADTINAYEIWNMTKTRDAFRDLLIAECSTLPSYLVSRKEGYDMDVLVSSGGSLFPSSLAYKVPEALHDADQAAKALAFELATACGFHLFRLTESVVKRYWDTVSDGAERPKLQTLGTYAGEMKTKAFGDEAVVESIKQMARLHRNPVIHPETVLSVEEAIGILGIARSAVGSMLGALPNLPFPVDGEVALPLKGSNI